MAERMAVLLRPLVGGMTSVDASFSSARVDQPLISEARDKRRGRATSRFYGVSRSYGITPVIPYERETP
jgi:hypothetical protein